MLPTVVKATDPTWFPLVMTDVALFHALLCTSALFVNDISDVRSKDMLIQKKHMLESIKLINARLSGNMAISDATITTILFMAKAEVSSSSGMCVYDRAESERCSIYKAILILGVFIWLV